jgi:membrane-bound ClpP family serine protease
MGNLDFSNNAGFSWYCIALVVVGIGLIVASALTRKRTAGIVIGVLIGAAMLVYGLYLTFIFQGGTYYISFYVIVAPVIFVLALIRTAKRKSAQPAQRAGGGVDQRGQ